MQTSRWLEPFMAMEIEGLSKRYGSLVALADVTLTLPTNRYVTLLGPSGSGKSTLLRLIAGLEEPDAGRIVLDGADITGEPPHRRRLGIVQQNYALFPHLSVRDNIAFGLRFRERDPVTDPAEVDRRVDAMLELVGLDGFSARMTNAISGGQKQRVSLARTLVTEPRLILLDEPLGALDANLRERMTVELRRIRSALGVTFLHVTGNEAEALAMGDRIREIFTTPTPNIAPTAQISGQIWADEGKANLWMVPTVFNFDSIGYRPDLVEAEEANTWTALFDDKFKGKTGLNVDPLIAFGQAILAMNSLGLLNVPNPGNPDVEAIDEASKFLIAKKKGGQFRALWGDFGELVNLLASGEMVLADAWQPAVMAVKAQGIKCSYAVPREGYRAWSIGISQIASSPNAEAVRAYADYWLSGPPAIIVSEQGYYSPTTNIKDVMAPEKYAFWYEGQPWKGAPERGIAEGDLRDGGSLEERASKVSYWHQWPDQYDHLIMRWDEFLSA